MIDVSFVVPVYKVEEHLRASLDSMLAQTHGNIEVILVDDGSPDASGAICDEYAARDARVRVIHKQNEGTGMARNSGMDAAVGEYIYFCDPDDLISPQLIADNLTLARANDADVVVFGYTQRMGEREETHLPRLSGAYDNAGFWARFEDANALMSSLWLRLFRRDFIVSNGLRAQRLSTAQDAYFLFDTYAAPFKRIVFNPKSYYTYIVHTNSAVTSYKPERFENQYRVSQHFDEVLAASPLTQEARRRLVDRRFVVSFIVAYKNLAHADEIPWKQRLEIVRGYAARPQLRAAIGRMRLRDSHTAGQACRTLLTKLGCFNLLLWLDRRSGSMI